jgi:hypothetical protein
MPLKKTLLSAVKAGQYKPGELKGAVKSAAAFFYWAWENYPGEPIAWNYTYKAIYGGSAPRLDSEGVGLLAKRASAIRKCLISKYETTLLSAPIVGACCPETKSVLVDVAVTASIRRNLCGARNLQNLLNTVKVEDLPNKTKADKNRREYLALVKDGPNSVIKQLLKSLNKAEKQLPPSKMKTK